MYILQGERGEEGPIGNQGIPGAAGTDGTFLPGGGASTYINWGRSDCPGGHSVVYEGRAVAPAFDNAGGGAEYICLHESGSAGGLSIMNAPAMSSVVGVHLETFADPSAFGLPMNIEPLSSDNGDAIACAVCLTFDSTTIMVPNSNMCPSMSWDMAYTGFLMTARDYISITPLNLDHDPVFGNTETANHLRPHFRTEYICLNQNFMEGISGTATPPSNEAKMSHVRIYCQSLVGLMADGCLPYINDNDSVDPCPSDAAHCSFGPLSCTVCTLPLPP